MAGSVPAAAGTTARATSVPPGDTAGRSRVTVKVRVPPGATAAGSGVRVTVVGSSLAPRTRTWAVAELVPRVAVTVTSAAWARPFTSTGALVWPAGTVTPPPATVRDAVSEAVMATKVSVAGARARVTVRGTGKVATPVSPTRV